MPIAPKPINQVFQQNNAWLCYFEKNKETLRPVVVDNIVKMLSCGLSIRGYATYLCSNQECTHTKLIPFTCKGRFCSSCGKKATAQWIRKQTNELPQTEWQHITFTMPKQLWPLFEANRQLLQELSRLAADTLLKLAKKKDLLPGIFTALHTFGRDLKWNPHVHLSTTRGGINEEKEIWGALYFKKEPLMNMWRYRVIKLIRDTYNCGELVIPSELSMELCNEKRFFKELLNQLYQKRWIIHLAKPTKTHLFNINYLGRYIKRPPIAQSRLIHYDGNQVVFRFLNRKKKQNENFTCTSEEFIERFIQHIPETHFRLIRYYGFLANRSKGKLLQKVYDLLEQVVQKSLPIKWQYLAQSEFKHDPLDCVLCGKSMRLTTRTVGLNQQALKQQHYRLAMMKPLFA